MGGPGKIFFGNKGSQDFGWVGEILVKGGLDVTYTKDIREILWKKYLFVSPLSTMSTALNITLGELAEDSKYMAKLEKMMVEVHELANKHKVTLTEEDIEASLAMLSKFPYKSKTSLQLDFENRNPHTEKNILVDFVIKNGEKFGVDTEHYREMNNIINSTAKS